MWSALLSVAGPALKVLKNPKILIGGAVVAALVAMGWYALRQAEKSGELAEQLSQAEARAEQNAAEAQRWKQEIERRQQIEARYEARIEQLQDRTSQAQEQAQAAGKRAEGDYARCRSARVPAAIIGSLRPGTEGKDAENGPAGEISETDADP